MPDCVLDRWVDGQTMSNAIVADQLLASEATNNGKNKRFGENSKETSCLATK